MSVITLFAQLLLLITTVVFLPHRPTHPGTRDSMPLASLSHVLTCGRDWWSVVQWRQYAQLTCQVTQMRANKTGELSVGEYVVVEITAELMRLAARAWSVNRCRRGHDWWWWSCWRPDLPESCCWARPLFGRSRSAEVQLVEMASEGDGQITAHARSHHDVRGRACPLLDFRWVAGCGREPAAADHVTPWRTRPEKSMQQIGLITQKTSFKFRVFLPCILYQLTIESTPWSADLRHATCRYRQAAGAPVLALTLVTRPYSLEKEKCWRGLISLYWPWARRWIIDRLSDSFTFHPTQNRSWTSSYYCHCLSLIFLVATSLIRASDALPISPYVTAFIEP